MFHVFYEFTQFTGVEKLNICMPHGSITDIDELMDWVEHHLSGEIRSIGIHIESWHRSHRAVTRLATHILMLSNHNTLATFEVYIAGTKYTLAWACLELGIPPPVAELQVG